MAAGTPASSPSISALPGFGIKTDYVASNSGIWIVGVLKLSKDLYDNGVTDGEWLVDQLTPEQAEEVFLLLQERLTKPISEAELVAAREEAKEEAMQAAESTFGR